MNARAFVLVLVALALSVAACGSSSKSSGAILPPAPSLADPAPYPAPSDPMARARAAGLVPETAEQLKYHVHSHLDVFIDGKHIIVPAGIGIDITDPRVHSAVTGGFPSYGGISFPVTGRASRRCTRTTSPASSTPSRPRTRTTRSVSCSPSGASGSMPTASRPTASPRSRWPSTSTVRSSPATPGRSR